MSRNSEKRGSSVCRQEADVHTSFAIDSMHSVDWLKRKDKGVLCYE